MLKIQSNMFNIAPFAFAASLSSCATASAATFSGIARSIDGDSLMIGQTEIRLFGIDAPEFSQTCQKGGQEWECGAAAAQHLSSLVTGKDVNCSAVDTDEYGRIVARCSVNGFDINQNMVASGYAVAFRHYSTAYISAEESAKANKRGIWGGTFSMPQSYRHQSTGPVITERSSPPSTRSRRASVAPSTTRGCVIKGNRASHGWIYHVPGMPYYERTRAEEMFCSEADAKAAGYRRAKVR